ncbi:hypothetical protein, partial [Klebsiella pneumoniae]|uniref:hypothetical protein n=1 Tax=Klebsiella pneumoniae TaxID=573 RepID=UPI001D0E6735
TEGKNGFACCHVCTFMLGRNQPGECKGTVQRRDRADKQATLSLIVCNIQTIDERQDKKWMVSMQCAPLLGW